jgi:nitrogenase molybdenum-iron protein alpha chain
MSNLTDDLTYRYASQKEPPTREMRFEVSSAFCGAGCALKEHMGSGCARFASRKLVQGGGCQLTLALGILCTFSNVIVIVHSPLGCSATNLGMAGTRATRRVLKGKPVEEFVWLHTNLGEGDVVYGGIDKLREAVLYAEKEYRPEAIVVANGCVPGIIGDDIDSLLDDLGEQLAAKIVPVHCEGFKSKFVASGYDSAYHGVLRKLIEPPDSYEPIISDDFDDIAERYRISKTVNVFNVGSTSYGDEAELSRLLGALGLIARVMPLYSSIDEIARINEAALNVSICPTHDDYLLGHLKERFGTEYIIGRLPIGVKNTGIWLREIAAFFHLEQEAENLVAVESAQLEEALEAFRPALAGKKIFIGGGEARIFPTGELYQSLGMKVIGLKSHNFDRFALPMVDDIGNEDAVIEVAPGQPAEELILLKKLEPDLYVGHAGANAWVSKLGIPNLPVYGQTINYMGYSGAYELARRAAKTLKNTSFSKRISANLQLPFRPAWFERNPLDNIKDGGKRAVRA